MKLGIIGCGKMGSALLGGILESGLCAPDSVHVHDAWKAAMDEAAQRFGVQARDSNLAVVEASDTVLLCVKPQGFDEMLEQIAGTSGKLLVSIAAGVTLDRLAAKSGGGHRLVRVMPNTPALVGRGASAYALGPGADEEDAAVAEKLLGSVGLVRRVEEKDLDAVTALSGSGPAYVFLLVESLVAGAVELGLDEDTALALATDTVAGSAELLRQTGESPATLRENVTSPGGTTHAALESFRADRFGDVVGRALRAARDRSVELGRG